MFEWLHLDVFELVRARVCVSVSALKRDGIFIKCRFVLCPVSKVTINMSTAGGSPMESRW